MQNKVKTGLNMTGAQMSPDDSERMLDAALSIKPDVKGTTKGIAEQRRLRVVESDQVGSVPIPGTAKGMVKTAINKLMGKQPEVLIDKLGERLAFERSGTRLYEALIAKAEALDGTPEAMLRDLRHFQKEEADHMQLVAEAIERLGADPTAQTPCADVTGVASMGIMQVITDPRTTLSQSLNAILMAELTDNAGWELLIELARQAGQAEIAEAFGKALKQEQHHLVTVRAWLERDLTSQLS